MSVECRMPIKPLKSQKTLADLTPFFCPTVGFGGPINGRIFHSFSPLTVPEAVEKPDGGLRGFVLLLEFNRDEQETREVIDRVQENMDGFLTFDEENDIMAFRGCTVYLWHVLETIPEKCEPGVPLSVVLPSADADKFIKFAQSTPEEPWTFKSVFHPDMVTRTYWKTIIQRLKGRGATNVTEVDEDTVTFEWAKEKLDCHRYRLKRTVKFVCRDGAKRKREEEDSE